MQFGRVIDATLMIDKDTGRPRGFGFVEMETEAEEDKAIAELDGAEWMGRVMKVNKAKPREDRGGGGGRAAGGWKGSNQRGYSRTYE